ncbi:transporter [Bosea sp. Leaf344]|uniref:AI-2E family transporter n=1 Tax=Bosea sp. Leaf344 TaxID=1736346 RepID=UPI0006FB5CA4|nr:AI-2E family transporter [Bosea sp. Leaf344]KQU50968.1 transporter [Bosea sp. Leaf344]
MRRPIISSSSRDGLVLPAGPSFGALGVAALIITGLYVGREVFIPVALAILLSFVLAPLVRGLRKLRVPRSLAVVLVVLVAFAALSALAVLMATQVAQLAGELPRYQMTMREKIASLRGSTAGSGALERASEMLQDLGKELDRPKSATELTGPPPGEPGAEAKPIPVEVRPPEPTSLQTLGSFLRPLVHPLTTTGIVLVFVIFILLQREDLRNRFIRLAGTYDLQKTTAALDDAAARLSRLFVSQLLLNSGFGLGIGIGLWIIGVPNPALWGVLTGIMRFVPYVGAIISAAFPLALAAAVDPGWTMLLWAGLLFLVAEPLAAHVLEPLVYGRSTGLSPVAVVASATFWTWLWGPIGLVLAMPLTICLVVLGRHVEKLEFLDVLLGDRPALSPPEIFYQRVLSGDPAETADKAEEVLKERSLSAYYDEVALEGLRLAKADLVRGVLDEERVARILETVREVVEDLADHDDRAPQPGDATTDAEAVDAVESTDDREGASDLPVLAPEEMAPPFRNEDSVVCIAGQGPLDEAAAIMLAQLLDKHGIRTAVESPEALARPNVVDLQARKYALVCLCYIDAGSPAHMRYNLRRLRRRLPDASLMLACLSLPAGATSSVLGDDTRADLVAGSLREAVKLCIDAVRLPPTAGETAALDAPKAANLA